MIRCGLRCWLVALCGVALGAATSGCSMLITARGVSSSAEIYGPETRAEVEVRFGKADETGTCPEGRATERRSIRRKVDWVCENVPNPRRYSAFSFHVKEEGCHALMLTYVYTLGLVDVLVFPFMAYRSERAKLHYAFVYDEDGRVLYRYDVSGTPSGRFGEAVRPLADSVFGQLKEGGCPSWGVCLGAFAQEARGRAACVGYPLTPEDERTLDWVQALGADVDAGRIAPDEALTAITSCLREAAPSCPAPPSRRSAPTPASGLAPEE